MRTVQLVFVFGLALPAAMLAQLRPAPKVGGHVVEVGNTYGVEGAKVSIYPLLSMDTVAFQLSERTPQLALKANGLGFFSADVMLEPGRYRFFVQKDGLLDLDTVVSVSLHSFFEFSMHRRASSSSTIPTGEQQPVAQNEAAANDDAAPVIMEDQEEYVEERPYRLPENFNGFSVEVVCAEELLPYSHIIYRRFDQIFLRKNGAEKFCYLIGRYDDLPMVRDFLHKSVKPVFPAAQLCQFVNGKKIYIQ